MAINGLAGAASMNMTLKADAVRGQTTPMGEHTKVPTSKILLLKMCRDSKEVKQLHSQLLVSGLINHPLNPGRLIESYVSTSHFGYAWSVFESISSPDAFAYNTMIRGLMLGEFLYESLLLYHQLLSNGPKPDHHTYTFVLKTCSRLKNLGVGKQVHGRMVKAGIFRKSDYHIRSSLIHMYFNCGCIESAERVHAEKTDKNSSDVLPMSMNNSMITGYFNLGHIEMARKLFNTIKEKDTATWSAVITGYTKNNMHAEALSIFQEMMASEVPVNESTLVSALSASAHLGALDQGRWIHRYIQQNQNVGGMINGVRLSTALIDMYAKCGCIEFGYEVFRRMSKKDVVAWGVMITGFALNGKPRKCFELFDEMVDNGTLPNEIIFVAILSACSHAGYIDLGFHYFNEMVRRFRIRPSIEHYGCMVDLLGRAGRLEDAEQLILSMSEDPNSVIWSALLSACTNHKDLKIGKRAAMQLGQLEEPMSADRYKLARNFFAANRARERAQDLWSFPEYRGLTASSGFSIVEVAGDVHQFVVGDISHPNSAEIYEMLNGNQSV